MSVPVRLADFVLRRPVSEFPDAVLKKASYLLLDTMGIAIAAGPMDAGRIARDTAVLLYGSSDRGHTARMLFDGRHASIAGAAYGVATQIDNLDGHDGYSPTKGHIGVVATPALAALAESRPDLTGPEALSCLTLCYEVAGRAATSLHATTADYHTSGAWNALGVVAMAARLRGLSDDQFRQALGTAEYFGPRSQMMREIANPTMLHDGSGMGALVGLSATVLAEHGFTGAPAITIEAPEIASHWQDLGVFWQVLHQYVKPYPICRWAHAAIDATRQLCLQHGLTCDDIKHVQINSFHHATALYQGMPDTTSKAQYSLRFAVAAYLLHGRIGLEHISGDALTEPASADMIERISVSESERHNLRFPAGRWADVVISTVDGRELVSGDVHARGGPEAPLTDEEVEAKYMEFAAPVIGERRAGAIREAILSLTQRESRFSDLSDLLYDPPANRQ